MFIHKLIRRARIMNVPDKTFASQVFDFIGHLMFGNPADRQLPKTFYYVQADRLKGINPENLTNPKAIKARLYEDLVRRELLDHFAKTSWVVGGLACALFLTIGAVSWALSDAIHGKATSKPVERPAVEQPRRPANPFGF